MEIHHRTQNESFAEVVQLREAASDPCLPHFSFDIINYYPIHSPAAASAARFNFNEGVRRYSRIELKSQNPPCSSIEIFDCGSNYS